MAKENPAFGIALILFCFAMSPLAIFADEDEQESKRAYSGLKKALRGSDESAVAYWVEVLANYPKAKHLRLILSVGEQFAGDPVRSSVQMALTRARGKEHVKFFSTELGKAKRISRVVLIIEALSAIRTEQTVAPLAKALNKFKDQKIQVTVLRALRVMPHKATVDALIAFFEKVEGQQDTVWTETRVSLAALTGLKYTLYEDWANWWLTTRDSWEPKTVFKGGTTGVFRPVGEGLIDIPRVFGVEVTSKRVVFVLDTSGSMDKPMGKDSKESGGSGPGPTRMERAKTELIKAILALRKDVRFSIVAYSKIASASSEKLKYATRRNKLAATEFVQSLTPHSTTSTGLALLKALSLKDVDTILLLSDGSPTSPEDGSTLKWKPVVEKVTKKNRFSRVSIHTLGFQGANVSFMKSMAHKNFGTYSNIR